MPQITITLTDKEKEILSKLAKKQDMPEERILIQALRHYQIIIEPPPPSLKKLENGIQAIAEIQKLLGSKFMYAQVTFFTDKTRQLTDKEHDAIKNKGFEFDGPNQCDYIG